MNPINESIRSDNRPRRLRQTPGIRRLAAENHLTSDGLVMPVFVQSGQDICLPIAAMPGIFRYSVDRLAEHLSELDAAGVRTVLLFGIPDDSSKDACGSAAHDPDGPVQAAIRMIRSQFDQFVVFADICLCEYTSHGHCGLLGTDQTTIENDWTLPELAAAAISCAAAGADGVAPSDMMDGRIGFIRQALDSAGYVNCLIMAYSAKYASAFYGPFREAAGSAPSFGDRRSYQMDPANRREAMREIDLDLAEGADIILVKPALAYLDIIRDAADRCDRPVAAYHVSGEYSMIKAAAEKGWIDERRIVLESLLGSRRAGAAIQITYHALDVARWLTAGEGL